MIYMKDKYLVVNCGSSSLKFSLYEMPTEKELINGYIEKIGFEDSFWTIKYNGSKTRKSKYIEDHGDAVSVMIDELLGNKVINSLDEIKGIGHRVLHGGEKYNDSVIIDENVLLDIVKLTNLGPLHHPGEIAGIRAMRDSIPSAINVAVFDTHTRIPAEKIAIAVNQRLPEDIRVMQSEEVEEQFHPRYAESEKTYEYHISNVPIQHIAIHPDITLEKGLRLLQ